MGGLAQLKAPKGSWFEPCAGAFCFDISCNVEKVILHGIMFHHSFGKKFSSADSCTCSANYGSLVKE